MKEPETRVCTEGLIPIEMESQITTPEDLKPGD
jgi:hypothetical protein